MIIKYMWKKWGNVITPVLVARETLYYVWVVSTEDREGFAGNVLAATQVSKNATHKKFFDSAENARDHMLEHQQNLFDWALRDKAEAKRRIEESMDKLNQLHLITVEDIEAKGKALLEAQQGGYQ